MATNCGYTLEELDAQYPPLSDLLICIRILKETPVRINWILKRYELRVAMNELKRFYKRPRFRNANELMALEDECFLYLAYDLSPGKRPEKAFVINWGPDRKGVQRALARHLPAGLWRNGI